ncbi:MAG TPA: serine/threonine-protein kinase [Bryobacteraceae bacterium]|jgi:serine/threonine-protein kinase|nr:serine/threonine-protein kinase [Bryobacteraceae bacterium]
MTQKVGSYQIVGTLRPGARPLYKAQAADQRLVALKTIPANGVTPMERERFLREAQICAGLDHPNLLKVHDSGEADGILYQAMDLLEGADLAKVFADGRQFSWEDKLSIMEQVCAGLDYAHKLNLVHRDIKPANIFLETTGNIRLLDFGMVRTSSSNLTQAGSTLGTVNYMAPEQIRGETCTAASDVFSSGIVFYQLCSGRHPFSKPGSGLAQIVSAIVFETPVPLGQIAAGAPEGLEFIINKALEKDAAKRWKGGGDFKDALALCRITIKMLPSLDAAGAAAGAGGSPPPVEDPDFGETKVWRRPGPVAPSRPPDSQAAEPTPPAPPPPNPPSPRIPPPAATPAPKPPEAVRKPPVSHVYCAACTSANAPGALTCSDCGAPLTSVAPQVPPPDGIPWRTIAFLATALILFLIVAIILLLKR